MAGTFKTVQGERFPSALVYSGEEYYPIDQEGMMDYPPGKFLDEVSMVSQNPG
jgi:hypothetical protein